MATMKCRDFSKYRSPYFDGQLRDGEREAVQLHLARCPQCAAELEALASVRRSLKALPAIEMPVGLNTALRVIASRELARRNARASFPAMFSEWRGSARLWMSNLMRPFALPVAGGVLSTLLLFGMLVPSFVRPSLVGDIPTSLYTEASVRYAGPLSYADDVEVELMVDGEGRVLDFTLPDDVMRNPILKRKIESDLLVTRFNPANFFGLPTVGKVKISFRKSHIDVKG